MGHTNLNHQLLSLKKQLGPPKPCHLFWKLPVADGVRQSSALSAQDDSKNFGANSLATPLHYVKSVVDEADLQMCVLQGGSATKSLLDQSLWCLQAFRSGARAMTIGIQHRSLGHMSQCSRWHLDFLYTKDSRP